MLKQTLKILAFVSAIGTMSIKSHAQLLTVTQETFETQTVGSAFGNPIGGATSSTIVAGGAAPTVAQALQVNGSIASGFGVEGTNFNPTVQPPANGSRNTSTNLANYTLSFDLAFEPGSATIPGFEVQLFNNNNSNQGLLLSINTAGMTANGVYQHFSMTLNNNSGQPFGTTTVLDPTTQSYSVTVDAVQGGLSTATAVIFNVDNFSITTVPEPATYVFSLVGAGALLMWRRRQLAR